MAVRAKQVGAGEFVEAEVTRVFAAQSIQGSRLVNATVTETQIASSALAAAGALDGGSGTKIDIAEDLTGRSKTFSGSGAWTFPNGNLQITGTPDSANDSVNKSYVDGLVTGIKWKEPVLVTDFIGERTVTQINALTPALGWAVVAADTGTPTAGTSDALAAGDLAEFDGTSWIKLVSNAAGQLPTGLRLIVAEPGITLFSPLTGSADEGKILESVAEPGTIDGAVSDFEDTGDAADGNAVLVQGPETADAESAQENNGFVFDGAVPTGTWTQFTGAGQINAGAGLTKAGNTLNVGDAGKGVQVNTDDVQVDASEIVNATSGLQQIAGVGNEHLLEMKLATGTPQGEAFSKDADGLKLNGDAVNVDFTPTNYTPTAAAGDVDDLDAHLSGIDAALAAANDTMEQEELASQVITGTDTALTATLSFAPRSAAEVQYFLNGILQRQGVGLDYTVSGQTITILASSGTSVDLDGSDILTFIYPRA